MYFGEILFLNLISHLNFLLIKDTLQNTLDELIKEKEELEKFATEIKEKLDKVNDQKIQKETLKNSLEKEIARFSKSSFSLTNSSNVF